MIKSNGCKCCNAYDHVCAMADVYDPAFAVGGFQSTGESYIVFDLKYQGKFNTDCKSLVPDNDLRAPVQFMEGGWQLDDCPDAVDTEQYDSDMLEMPTLFHAEEFFIKESPLP